MADDHSDSKDTKDNQALIQDSPENSAQPNQNSKPTGLLIHQPFPNSIGALFRAWTVKEYIAEWWVAKGWQWQYIAGSIKEGQFSLSKITSDDGFSFFERIDYVQILAPSRMVFLVSSCDEVGNVTAHPFITGYPTRIRAELILFGFAAKECELRLTWSPHQANEEEMEVFVRYLDLVEAGWQANLEQLRDHLDNIQ